MSQLRVELASSSLMLKGSNLRLMRTLLSILILAALYVGGMSAAPAGALGKTFPAGQQPSQDVQEASAGNTAVTVQQGQIILTEETLCSITVVDHDTAYTAQHCGESMKSLGSSIYNLAGQRLGRVSATQPGFDVVKIKLEPNVRPDRIWERRAYDTIEVGEQLHVRGFSQDFPASTLSNEPLIDWIDYQDIGVVVKPVNSLEGTSGGPMLDAQGRVVGVSVGAATFERPGHPTEAGSVFFPWYVIDGVLG